MGPNISSQPAQTESFMQQQPISPKKKRNLKIILLIFFITSFVAAFIAGGYFLGIKQNSSLSQNQQKTIPTFTQSTPIPTSTPNLIKCSVRAGQPQIPCPSGYYCVNTCNPAPNLMGCAQYDVCRPNPT